MKKQPKLTPWFPADVKPVRVGWYPRNWGGSWADNDYWDGRHWSYGSLQGKPAGIAPANREWRGLASDPAA